MAYTQANRPLAVQTPLGADVLLLDGFSGIESLSELYRFQLDMLAPVETEIAFDRLLGQKVSATLLMPDNKKRFFCGWVSKFTQGPQVRRADGEPTFVRYRAEMVPEFWFLQHKFQSRIFQQKKIPDILKQVLTGLKVTYHIQGTFEPRDYCAQYRESDYAFASRLMEEEGIYYFFKHADGGCEMILANSPEGHPYITGGGQIAFHEEISGHGEDDHVYAWEKSQEVRSGKTSLWDHCFEMPDKNLEAVELTLDSVGVGGETHKLKVGGNDKFEVYDYPGHFAQRFDGVAPGGADKSGDLQKIFTDNKRTTLIRRQADTSLAVAIGGAGNVRYFAAGHKFTLQGHFSGDGPYVLTRVEHTARLEGAYVSKQDASMIYRNTFRCTPTALPFRPQRKTAKARVEGTHTATVVGPQGEEIFTDKYGRVKVQFHWDRQGKKDQGSSCWVRVGTPWAGQQWGLIHIPRIGQEVIVDFLEGDPDQPIVIGSVYNSAYMPPYKLPEHKTLSGIRTHSTLKGDAKTFNEIRFEDKKDAEDIYFHAQKDYHRLVEHDSDELILNNALLYIQGIGAIIIAGKPMDCKNDGSGYLGDFDTKENAAMKGAKPLQGTAQKFTIEKGHRDELIIEGSEILLMKKGSRTETLEEGNDTLTMFKGDRTITLKKGNETIDIKDGTRTHFVKSDDTLKVDANQSVTIKGNREVLIKTGNDALKVSVGNITIKASAGAISIEAAQSIKLKVGPSTIELTPAGITIKGTMVKVEGQAMTSIKAPITTVKGDGILAMKGGIMMVN